MTKYCIKNITKFVIQSVTNWSLESIYVSKDYFQITNFKNLNDFFGNLEKKFNSIRITDDYIIFKLEDNKDLIQAIIKDARFKKIALKAEKYHLLVLKENVKELIRLLAEHGYYLIEK